MIWNCCFLKNHKTDVAIKTSKILVDFAEFRLFMAAFGNNSESNFDFACLGTGQWATRNSSLKVTSAWRLTTGYCCFGELSWILKAEWPGRSGNRSLRNSAFSQTFNFTPIFPKLFWYETETVGCWWLKSWDVKLNFWTWKLSDRSLCRSTRLTVCWDFQFSPDDVIRNVLLLFLFLQNSPKLTFWQNRQNQNSKLVRFTFDFVRPKTETDATAAGWPLNALKS